jgi:hypothetical protein
VELHQRYSGLVREAEDLKKGREQVLPSFGPLNGNTKGTTPTRRTKKAAG